MENSIIKSKLTERAFQCHKNERAYKRADTLDFVITLILVIVAVFAFRAFIFETVMVSGESMYATLEDRERMFVEKFTYWFDSPQRGDIVICYYPPTYKKHKPNETYVKRVIGLPGETIKITGNVVYIKRVGTEDFIELEENYINPEDLIYPIYPDMEYQIPYDCVFVMGDNRDNSSDSRASNIGAIKLTEVIGRAYGVVYPFSNFRELNRVNYGE